VIFEYFRGCNMKVKYLVTVPFIALCLILPSLAVGADGQVKVGDITAFTGEVLARTKGVWVKIKTAPHPVYSSDKIVTRRGRAEIGLVDGGVMRLNLDSNVSIEQVEEEEGFAFKNKVSTRQVNLLVGEVWFSVKVEKGNKLKVRTPTMTAAVRGSAATISQGPKPDEPAKYAYIEGDIETAGNFKSIPPKTINWDAVRKNAADLPSSDPAIDNSKIQQAAVEATKTRSEALQAAAKAESELAQAAAAELVKAREAQEAEENLKLQLMALADANVTLGKAAVLDNMAEMVAEQEKMVEAQVFNEVQTINEVQNIISQLGQKITRLEVISQELEEIAEEVDKATKEGDLQTAEDALQKSEQLMLEVPKITVTPTEISRITGTTMEETTTTEEAAATEEEVGYTEEETTTTTTTTSEPPPDTQDLPSSQDLPPSSPGY
jgi:hypothetical protein